MSKRQIALAGNPNVGKSTVFNELTGMHRHTGNWIGKTVDTMAAGYYYKFNDYEVVDLPGTYSLTSLSEEERLASEFLKSEELSCIVCVIDSTVLERSLVLAYEIMRLSSRVVILLNLCDEAKKKGIYVDSDKLSKLLGVPVVRATARSGKGINELLEQVHLITTGALSPQPDTAFENIYKRAKEVAEACVSSEQTEKISPLDRLVLGKYTSFIMMGLLFAAVLFITIKLSNYPSQWLKSAFDFIEERLALALLGAGTAEWAVDVAVHGVLRVLFWVVSVMLPPMLIFFPLFALLEDFGLLPRIAFNLDRGFEKCGACGKQALTGCMGLGCNAVGVTGARIIETKRERLIAIITNSLTPCNGRFPLLITLCAVFFGASGLVGAAALTAMLALSLIATLLASKLLSSTVLKGMPSSFVLELPSYRRPQIVKTVMLSLKEKVLRVLMRAVVVAAPAGLVLWLLANIKAGGVSLLMCISDFFDPFARLIGLDGIILIAFILGFPANEIVLPIILMCYLSGTSLSDFDGAQSLGAILVSHGWTVKTAVCTCVFSLFHFPCSTTLITIYKETRSIKWTLMSVALPLLFGIALCGFINLIL